MAKNNEELLETIQDIGRITSEHSELEEGMVFDDASKLTKLRTIIPTDLHKYIAIAPGNASTTKSWSKSLKPK